MSEEDSPIDDDDYCPASVGMPHMFVGMQCTECGAFKDPLQSFASDPVPADEGDEPQEPLTQCPATMGKHHIQ